MLGRVGRLASSAVRSNTVVSQRAMAVKIIGQGRSLVESEMEEIVSLHHQSPEKWPVQQLAVRYGVRKEIVMGIIRMKELEAQALKKINAAKQKEASVKKEAAAAAAPATTAEGETPAEGGDAAAAAAASATPAVENPNADISKNTPYFREVFEAAKSVSRKKFLPLELQAQLAGSDPNAAAFAAAKVEREAGGHSGSNNADHKTKNSKPTYVFLDPLDDTPQSHVHHPGHATAKKTTRKMTTKDKEVAALKASAVSQLAMTPSWPVEKAKKAFSSRYIIVETGPQFSLNTRGILVREKDGSCRSATNEERVAAQLRVGGSDPMNRFHTHDPAVEESN